MANRRLQTWRQSMPEALRSWKQHPARRYGWQQSGGPAQLRDGNNHKFPNQRVVNPKICVTNIERYAVELICLVAELHWQAAFHKLYGTLCVRLGSMQLECLSIGVLEIEFRGC